MPMLKFILLAAVVFPTVSFAVEAPPAKPDQHDPVPSKGGDPRICTFPYSDTNMLRIRTPSLVPVRIIFSEGAVPDAVAGQLVTVLEPPAASGQQQKQPQVPLTDWVASNVGNTLMLQPLRGDMQTSVVFVTTRGTEQRNYVIELNVGPPPDAAKPDCLQISYSYPQRETAEARAAAESRNRASKIGTSLTQARFSAPRNWHYDKQGADCATLTPSGWNWLSDDGNQTAMLFPPHMDGSSIYSRETDDDKNEQLITPIPFTTKIGTLMILPDTYRQIVLRRNNKSCALRNGRFDAFGTQAGGGSGTISPDVIRARKQQVSAAVR